MKVLRIIGLIVLVILSVLAVGVLMNEASINKDIENLFQGEYDNQLIYSEEILQDLPTPVQRYFKNVLTDGQPYIQSVRLKHGGQFRTKAEQSWSNIKGEEYFATNPVGFVWIGKLPFVAGVDKFVQGRGNLKIKLLSIFPVVDAVGEKADQGELLRWLGETPLFPTALLPSENISWTAIDDSSAKVIFNNGNIKLEAVFVFNDKGEAISFESQRYKEEELENWTGYYRDYMEVDGVKVPSEIEAEWNLEEGDFSYAKFKIEEIEYNVSKQY